MTSGHPRHSSHSHPEEPAQSGLAAIENFVRLQQHQVEYLKWLEESEKKPEMDSYVYKKIR